MPARRRLRLRVHHRVEQPIPNVSASNLAPLIALMLGTNPSARAPWVNRLYSMHAPKQVLSTSEVPFKYSSTVYSIVYRATRKASFPY
ncbi:hypothetical protein Cob_v005788 [Colletotrichum orbiculare MAFF 240422]|uniref:Uncharacterized protein n=1 Tax=Colletotrichum orbiculare (strain 104-T / ATCC 96160 / CBS 514.97 / LARS 414 / MAFF 240422) TaxID=1213857 RepID=A0A484FSB3_COLOR|nr:hypothetical protein Cob_v005788 [Colletotrichum orbiculare MAFF 240422]